jgi:hypothetical protein
MKGPLLLVAALALATSSIPPANAGRRITDAMKPPRLPLRQTRALAISGAPATSNAWRFTGSSGGEAVSANGVTRPKSGQRVPQVIERGS